MLYPVEAEHDVHDRKSSPHPSIGLSVLLCPPCFIPEGQVPQMSIQVTKAVVFPDGTTTVPRWGDYPGPSFLITRHVTKLRCSVPFAEVNLKEGSK